MDKNEIKKSFHTKKIIFKQKISFFLLSLINNYTYVLVLSASNSLAEKFNSKKYMSLFSTFLTIFSIIAIFINSLYLIKLSYKKRFTICFLIQTTGILIVILSILKDEFIICLFGASFIGVGNSLGILTIQGFLQNFDESVFYGFTTGSGLAGIFGSFFYTLMKIFGFSDLVILIILLFTFVGYFFIFNYILESKKKIDSVLKKKNDGVLMNNKINVTLNFGNFFEIVKQIKYFSFNLAFLTFLHYGIISYIGSRINDNIQIINKENNFFQIFQIIFQVGVFFSRSSIIKLETKKIHFFTYFHLLLYFVFVLVIILKIKNIFFIMSLVFFLGINSGLSYVNTISSILNSKDIKNEKKEMALSLQTILVELSIFSNGFAGIIFNYLI